MITKYLEILNLDGVIFHDDWASQRAPFSLLMYAWKWLCPILNGLWISALKGALFQQHCCGKNEMLVRP
jgi:hypothetical protein